MKIIHRISLNPNEKQLEELLKLGADCEEVGAGAVVFLMEEGHPNWPSISRLIQQWKMLDMVSTRFTKKELAQSQSILMEPGWHSGYPQPENEFGYLHITYDDRAYCNKCGVGLKQKAPFRMLHEPKWGSNDVLQLNWVFDEFFVTPNAFASVFEPFGVESLPVLNHKTGRNLESVVQLKIVDYTIAAIVVDDLPKLCCSVCNRVRLGKRAPGRFPHVEMADGSHIAKTRDYFGTDAIAWNEVVISAALYRAAIEKKLKGVCFEVVAQRGESLR
jgi:hypothetical protein